MEHFYKKTNSENWFEHDYDCGVYSEVNQFFQDNKNIKQLEAC
jgi:hypothetical protein